MQKMPQEIGGPAEDEPVFYDSSHRRESAVRWAVALGFVALVFWVALFWVSIFVLGKLSAYDPAIGEGSVSSFSAESPGSSGSLERAVEEFVCTGEPLEGELIAPTSLGGADVVLRRWPEGAVPVLAEHCSGLRSVYTEWFRIDASGGSVVQMVPAYAAEPTLRAALGPAGRDVTLKAIVELPLPVLPGPIGLADPEIRQRIVARLTSIAAHGYKEVCISPSGFRPWHLEGLKLFLAQLQPNLAAARVKTCLVAEAEGPFWRDAELVRSVDSVLLLAFRLPDAASAPAPLAASDWFDSLMSDVVQAVGSEKLRVALGAFGTLWREGAPPEQIAFSEAMRLVAAHGGMIEFPEETGNTRVTFTGADGRPAEGWLLDAPSLWNQLVTLENKGVEKVALWSAGLEDPAVWRLLNRDSTALDTASIEDLRLDDYVGYDGEGPFIRLTGSAAPGRRELFRDTGTNRIVGQVYSRVPTPISFERYGASADKIIALSFDDGPDASFTTELLNVLRDKRVPGAFFVIGRNVARQPDLIRRMVDEGHEVGSHTFFHPDTGEIGEFRLSFEINAVQRLLASVTGRATRLFRSPYGQSEGPTHARDALSSVHLLNEGYLVVGSDIVPRDWEGLSADEIVDHVLTEVRQSAGSNVIVMHDGGGDRSATVAAVPRVIDALRAEGYRFVSLGALLGLDRDEVMPLRRDAMTWIDELSFSLMSNIGRVLVWAFWIAVLGGALRAVVILVLALLRRPHSTPGEAWPTVTVVIPAFNEADSIADAVATALASDYPDIKVVVIDDGSSDGSGDIVESAFGSDPRVTLIRESNRGKWKALDTAYRYIDSEVVVAVDADTRLQPDAVRLLAAHFGDPRVGAVAGNVKVRNRAGLLPRLQSLEYITAQNVDRRAAEFLNAMLVVPGAIGAWRPEAVRAAGLYSPSTITEDADLTVSVLRLGYRVRFEPNAVSYTNVPDTVPAFLRQRLRWTFGMMQTAWKHRGAMREGRAVGLISIPDLWFAGVALGLLAPLADLVLLGVLVNLGVDYAMGRSLAEQDLSITLLAGYLVLPAIDLLALLLALLFERREPLSLVLLVPLQRLVYRPLLYVSVYRAVARAIRGARASWGRTLHASEEPAPGK